MPSELKVNKLSPYTGTTLTLGDSGDTITIPSGATQSITGTLSGAGTIDLSSATITLNDVMKNTPAFEAHLSAAQTLTDDTITKIEWDTVVFDTNSAYDNTTNYRFTVPAGLGGKYFVYAYGQCRGDGTNEEVVDTNMQIRKNGSSITRSSFGSDSTATVADRNTFLSTFTVLDLSAGDYLEIYALINSVSGTATFISSFSGTQIMSRFGAYRLIGV